MRREATKSEEAVGGDEVVALRPIAGPEAVGEEVRDFRGGELSVEGEGGDEGEHRGDGGGRRDRVRMHKGVPGKVGRECVEHGDIGEREMADDVGVHGDDRVGASGIEEQRA